MVERGRRVGAASLQLDCASFVAAMGAERPDGWASIRRCSSGCDGSRIGEVLLDARATVCRVRSGIDAEQALPASSRSGSGPEQVLADKQSRGPYPERTHQTEPNFGARACSFASSQRVMAGFGCSKRLPRRICSGSRAEFCLPARSRSGSGPEQGAVSCSPEPTRGLRGGFTRRRVGRRRARKRAPSPPAERGPSVHDDRCVTLSI